MLERDPYFEHFVQSLDGNETSLEPYLRDPTHMARARVYRNNSVTASAEAIFKDYPAVERLVGTEFLRAAAAAFVKAHPPQDPILALYGDEFAAFLKTFPPAKDLPYLADVAHLDRAWMNTLFAANAQPLGPEDLAGLDEAQVSALAPGLHPSAQILKSDWPAWEIWRASREETPSQNITLEKSDTAALLWWSPKGVADMALNPGECLFLDAVAAGASFGDAMGKAAFKLDPDSLFQFFSKALSAGVFAKPEGLNT